ncbi:uncharacterized protein LOC62_02G002937 [Vanrija pseudolonga]|uniref:Ubiquitin-like domain-containing protein n=1 Tax=Vanrija pseudolonga TaxID=143232 RepID=A0AAF0Y3A0_9TREE|nr:hypothetical protein LOC62_02G002937 [Vanrija pseudolonga]
MTIVKQEPGTAPTGLNVTKTNGQGGGGGEEDAMKDIKPKIAGLEPMGLDFKPTTQPFYAPRLPGQILIRLLTSKGTRTYSFDLLIHKSKKAEAIKNYLVKYYDYEFDKLRLIYDGEIVRNYQTLEELEVEENDTFDVYLERGLHSIAMRIPPVIKQEAHLADYYGYGFDRLRIIYDGKVLRNDDTMAELGVEDYDTFDVSLEAEPVKPPQVSPAPNNKEGELPHEGIRKHVTWEIEGPAKTGVKFDRATCPMFGPRPPGKMGLKLLGRKDGKVYSVWCWISPDTKLKCVKFLGYEVDKLRLLYDGIIVYNQTPAELEVEDGDEVDVFLERVLSPGEFAPFNAGHDDGN